MFSVKRTNRELNNHANALIRGGNTNSPDLLVLVRSLLFLFHLNEQIFHNLALVAAIQVIFNSIQFVNNVTHKRIMKFATEGKLERILLDKRSSATSYCEWRAIATQLDELKGLNIWRSIDVSSLNDSSIVAKRISGTIDLFNNGDSISCYVFIRGGLV
jgi:hypothetical protein